MLGLVQIASINLSYSIQFLGDLVERLNQIIAEMFQLRKNLGIIITISFKLFEKGIVIIGVGVVVLVVLHVAAKILVVGQFIIPENLFIIILLESLYKFLQH